MSSGHDPRRKQEIRHEELPASDDAASAAEPTGDMLREIVSQTASSMAKPQEIDPAVRAAMLNVARRYAGHSMVLDPAGTALLEAMLRVQFPMLAERPPLLARTARTVAGSLLADPTARLRVEHLWATLAEECE
jgi:hypothetical protein